MKQRRNINNSSYSHNIGDIYISFQQLDNERVILILENRGQNQEVVNLQFQHTNISGTVLLKSITLPIGETSHLILPTRMMEYNKFECRLKVHKPETLSILDLKKSLKEVISKSHLPDIISPFSRNEPELKPKTTFKMDTESEVERDNTQLHVSPDAQHEEVINGLNKLDHEIELEELTSVNKLDNNSKIEKSIKPQEEPTIANQIVQTIQDWILELEQSKLANQDVVQTLRYSEQAFKEEINTITDCKQLNAEEFGIFIKDKLFKGVARFIQFELLPKQLIRCLELVGFEVVPIDIGKTQADARIHAIQASRKTECESGSIVEVLLPGLRRIADGEIIQKPVVIRGE